MQSLIKIIERIKDFKKVRNDGDVAILLNIKPKTLAAAKSRNSIPFEELSAFCKKEGISLDWLLSGERDMKPYLIAEEQQALYVGGDFVFVPQVSGEISAGGGLVADDTIEMRIAFRREWIQRKGDPHSMSLIRVSGDSMEPTLLSGDLVLIDHNRNVIDPQGGIYAISMDSIIMIKRLQLLYTQNLVKIISDNPRYDAMEIDPARLRVNGKLIWFGRELER